MLLGDAERNLFLAEAVEREHPSGAALMNEQEDDQRVCLLLEGRVDILVLAPDGRLVIFDQAGPGELVGVLATIDGRRRSASVVACTPGRAAWVTASIFTALMRDPGFSRTIQIQLVAKIRALSEYVYELSTLLVRERLIRELLRRYDACVTKPGRHQNIQLTPRPTQAYLAARIGTHREAVAREMSRLARRGVIIREGRDLIVPSREKLAAILDENSVK